MSSHDEPNGKMYSEAMYMSGASSKTTKIIVKNIMFFAIVDKILDINTTKLEKKYDIPFPTLTFLLSSLHKT